MGNHQILDFFGSNSLLVVARVARARSPGRRPTKEGALQSARSALFCQATNEGGTATKNARKGKKKWNKEILEMSVFGSNTVWVIGVILKISLIKKARIQLQFSKVGVFFIIGGFLKVGVFWFKNLMGNRLFS